MEPCVCVIVKNGLILLVADLLEMIQMLALGVQKEALTHWDARCFEYAPFFW